ncbi:MAG TPA: hypothetical protein VMU84_01700 [Thermoanaerobaculia bacterium]|nr:hypothetical protein [Thermoanaerobaculia bacterium]
MAGQFERHALPLLECLQSFIREVESSQAESERNELICEPHVVGKPLQRRLSRRSRFIRIAGLVQRGDPKHVREFGLERLRIGECELHESQCLGRPLHLAMKMPEAQKKERIFGLIVHLLETRLDLVFMQAGERENEHSPRSVVNGVLQRIEHVRPRLRRITLLIQEIAENCGALREQDRRSPGRLDACVDHLQGFAVFFFEAKSGREHLGPSRDRLIHRQRDRSRFFVSSQGGEDEALFRQIVVATASGKQLLQRGKSERVGSKRAIGTNAEKRDVRMIGLRVEQLQRRDELAALDRFLDRLELRIKHYGKIVVRRGTASARQGT